MKPLLVPVICTVVGAVIELVGMLKEANREPAGTVTDAGTLATDGSLLDKAMVKPPLGAFSGRDASPPAVFPPVVFPKTNNSKRGSTESEAVFVLPLREAETVVKVNDCTALALKVKVALLAPCGTATVAGTETTEGLLLDKEIVTPPAGAGETSFTVPVEEAPSDTSGGEKLNEKGGTVPLLK